MRTTTNSKKIALNIVNLALLGFFTLLLSCTKQTDTTPLIDSSNFSALVLSEGNFGKGNASLSAVDTTLSNITNDLFSSVNKRPLGDVALAMTKIDNKIYVCLNNSAKIEVLNATTFESLSTIITPGYSSPSDIVDLKDGTALIFDMGEFNFGSNNIYKLDLETETITETLNFDFATIATIGGYNYIELDPLTNTLWLYDESTFSIKKFDKALNLIAETFLIGFESIALPSPSYGFGSKIRIASNGDKFINGQANSVYRIDALGNVTLVVQDSSITAFYNFDVSPLGDIWICDVLDYSSRGLVNIYDSLGNKKGSLNAGIIPRDILFY